MNPPRLTWNTLDWTVLDRLRDTFLAGKPTGTNYWTSRSDLENYDFTFGQRIAWKWDAVLRELKLRGWKPPGSVLLDWGCGSGIAGRRVIDFFGSEHFKTLRVFDRSALAMEFAAEKARETLPSLRAEGRAELLLGLNLKDAPQRVPATDEAIGTLVISHVLNELDEASGRALREVIDRANAVLWLEPGTYADSRSLIAMREALCETFHVIAPCTHQCGCGLLAPENERHWCHHFAAPPAGIMGDSNWVRFAQRAGIDLRSLPYSFLVLERKGVRDPVPGLLPDGYSRIIGEPRFYKGYAKVFSCQKDGVRELMLQKRDAPEFFKALKKCEAEPVYQWMIENGRIGLAKALAEERRKLAIQSGHAG